MKCKPYSEITVEIRTQLKAVKITSNIFAVQASDLFFLHSMKLCCRFLGTKEKEASPLDQTKETEEAEAD